MPERICLGCGGIVDGDRACPRHPDDPLLDPREDAVRDVLIAEDDRRRQRHFGRWSIFGVFAGFSLSVAIAAFLAMFDAIPGAYAYETVTAWIISLSSAGAAAGRSHARRTFKPLYGQWTNESSLPALTAQELAAVEPTPPNRSSELID